MLNPRIICTTKSVFVLPANLKNTRTTYRYPEESIIQQRLALEQSTPLQHDNWHLEHHCKSTISSQLLRDAAHDKLVSQCGDKERQDSSGRSGDYGARGEVYMPAEEVVDRHVPFA